MTLIWPLLFSFVLGYSVRIVHTYPHDRSSFTQGLEYHDGLLYEGTGLKGQSTLRVERLETGELIRRVEVPAEFFGEGITVFGNRIFQLTWQAHVGFVYGRSTFRPLGRFRYPGEGWGLTNDGKQVYMSDGSAQIRCLDPANLSELPALEDLSADIRTSDRDYIDYVATLDRSQLAEQIDFAFTDGVPGRMSREEMLMHVITHGIGHRGQVSALMLLNALAPAKDGFTTYLHEAEASVRRRAAA